MISLTLKPAPLSTNHIYKISRSRMYMTDEGKSMKELYQWQIKTQWKRSMIQGPVMLTAYVYYGDKKKRDLDNSMKILLDSMSHMVYKDDSQIQSLWIIKRYDEKNPRVDIDVQEMAA